MVTATRFNIKLNNGQPCQETNIMYNSVFDKYIVSSKTDGIMIISSEELCGTEAIILNDKLSTYYHFSFVFQLLCLLLLFIFLLMVCITVIKTIHRRRNRKALHDSVWFVVEERCDNENKLNHEHPIHHRQRLRFGAGNEDPICRFLSILFEMWLA